MVWTCLKVFWLSKDNSAGHNTRKKEETVDREKKWEDNIKEWTGMTLLAQLRQLKTGLGGKGLL